MPTLPPATATIVVTVAPTATPSGRVVPWGSADWLPAALLLLAAVIGGLATLQFRRRGAGGNRLPFPERRVSVGFAPANAAATPLPAELALACGHDYYFWIELGPPVVRPRSPGTAPPAGAHLTVTISAYPDELRLSAGEDTGELHFQPDGTVAGARQAVQPRGVPPGSALVGRRLFFPVRTPDVPGVFRLRCSLYFRQVLVQSRVVETQVLAAPRPVGAAIRPVVDYTLSRALDLGHLAGLAPHRLSVLLNSNGGGTHTLRLFGSDGTQVFKADASFDGHALQGHTEKARGALRWAAWGDEAYWETTKRYLYENIQAPNVTQMAADLIRLAIRGYRFYDALIQGFAPTGEQADSLAALMRTPGLVQIALKQSPRLLLPAALFYDFPLDANADPAAYRLCPEFLAALRGPDPLADCACFEGACPTREAEQALTTVCPGGFWGYRHYLGMPLSLAEAPDIPTRLTWDTGPRFTVGVSTDPGLHLREAHEDALRHLHQHLGWSYATSRDALLALLKETKPHVVYFYCHGGIENEVPYLEVGYHDQGITPDNLRAKRIRWGEPRPLVFINGCETTALAPEVALEFVSAFVSTAGASGVIGTEITIFEPLARAFAEECLRRFVAGEEVGKAVRGARLGLLKAGNPLGLVYVPFVMAGLRLVPQSAA